MPDKINSNFINLKGRPPKNIIQEDSVTIKDKVLIPISDPGHHEVTIEDTSYKLNYNLYIRHLVFDSYSKYPETRDGIIEYLENRIDKGISYPFVVFNGALYKYEDFKKPDWVNYATPHGKYEIVEDVFFTADTHFGAERTRTLSKRPYLSTKLMDADMISKWYSKVATMHGSNKNDRIDPVIFHLGDVGDLEPLKCLPGRKILVQGNYEVFKYFEDFDPYLEVFEQVHTSSDKVLIAVNGFVFELCHGPLSRKTDQFCLFGHIHSLQKVKRFGLNVGVDCHNYAPISFQDVMFYKNAIEQHYDNEVFCTEETKTTKEIYNEEV